MSVKAKIQNTADVLRHVMGAVMLNLVNDPVINTISIVHHIYLRTAYRHNTQQ